MASSRGGGRDRLDLGPMGSQRRVRPTGGGADGGERRRMVPDQGTIRGEAKVVDSGQAEERSPRKGPLRGEAKATGCPVAGCASLLV